MKLGILAAVLLYELIVIVGIGMWLSKKQKAAAESDGNHGFLLSGRDMPTAVVAVTMALTVLGTVHILGIFEISWGIGATSMWVSFSHVILLVVATLGTGRWARRLNVSTIPELVEMLHGKNARLVVCCAMAPVIWGILTLECQGLGIILSAVTGWSIKNGATIGAVLGVMYVIFAGMKEIGWVNLINTIVMYVGLVVATIVLTTKLPNGWDGVANYYIEQDQDWMLSIFGTPDLMLTFALGFTFSVVFCQGISQMLMQTALSAKSEMSVKKALWIAAPVNGLFGLFTVCMGMAAKTIPEFHALGPKMAAPTMLVALLPGWLVAWLLASFIAAVLSTFAMTSMTPATIFTMDIYKNLFNPDMTEADEKRITRIGIVILAILAVISAANLPPIVGAIGWLFAWMVPVFWMVVFGLFWKRSQGAAIATMIIAWIGNSVWSFTSLAKTMGMADIPNVYVTLLLTFVVGIASLAMSNGKPGYFKEQKNNKATAIQAQQA